MGPTGSAFQRKLRRSGVAVAIAGAGLLAACSSTGGGGFGLFKNDPNKGVVTVASENSLPTEMFLKQGYCPSVEIRPGTEALLVYERGHDDDPAFVRYQGSIAETARECSATGPDTLTIKVGIAGRVVGGPKAVTGTATLPLRVAVVKQNGGNIFYSEVFKVAVTLAPPQFSGEFSQVIDQVNLKLGPGDHNLIVYVGFDEGAPAKPTG